MKGARAVPRTNKRACLCEDRNTYSKECCKGVFINQGIGNTHGTPGDDDSGAFSNGFSDGFDI